MVYPGFHFSSQKQVLSIYTFGQFRVIRGDVVLCHGLEDLSWQVFAFLLTQKGIPQEPQRIMRAFWPQNIQIEHVMTTLEGYLKENENNHEQEYIVRELGAYTLSPQISLWFDAREFELLCTRRPTEALNQECWEEEIALFEKGLALYKGAYLMELKDVEWVLNPRQRYEQLYIDGVIYLSELLRPLNRQWVRENLLQDACRQEPPLIPLHLKYIEALLEGGQAMKAQEHYNALRHRLLEEQGVELYPSLEAIYEKLLVEKRCTPMEIGLVTQENIRVQGGPVIYERDAFRRLYRLEEKKGFHNMPVLLLTLDILGPQRDEDMEGAFKDLQSILMENLEENDSICPWEAHQYLILLTERSLKEAEELFLYIQRIFQCRSPWQLQGRFHFICEGMHQEI